MYQNESGVHLNIARIVSEQHVIAEVGFCCKDAERRQKVLELALHAHTLICWYRSRYPRADDLDYHRELDRYLAPAVVIYGNSRAEDVLIGLASRAGIAVYDAVE